MAFYLSKLLSMTHREILALCRCLMDKHGLGDWSIKWIGDYGVLGRCVYPTKQIQLHFVYSAQSTEAQVKDTILHEIAHAKAGHSAGHGPLWRNMALRVGAAPRACTQVTFKV